ncbi:MAG TPA: hypothetical protein VI504_01010 [Candidatus Eisenbacteria bacterium]|jgi:hypothetical protein
MAIVRPVGPEDFDQIHPLLLRFGNSAMDADDWRRMLFDLPWRVDEPHRGFGLFEDGRAVGFLGTIFSVRSIAGTMHRFCNLSSWIVEEPHRSSSVQLLLPVLGMRTHTIVNLTASPAAHEIFTKLGFRTLEERQVLVPSRPAFRPGAELLLDHDAMRAALDDRGRTILDDMRGTHARQVVIRRANRTCHVVATRSPWKGRLRLAHVQYASDWRLLEDELALASWAFLRSLGTLGLRIDHRHLGGRPHFGSKVRALSPPTLYRPADSSVSPADVDGLYTELVGQRW